ncbi:MAG: hypothetical protein KGQ59_07585 [Bdellovibrionales bacterium]|nr:hypothetical protein [Bdellovibrionales bacterium]
MTALKNCRPQKPASFVVAAALMSMLSILVGCSAKKIPVATDIQPLSPEDITFVVKGLATGAETETQIFAEHGIQFKLSGGLEVGPAPNGQVHRQELNSQDLEKLQESWSQWMKSGFHSTETCLTTAGQNEFDTIPARISVNIKDHEKALVRIDGGQICGPADSAILKAFSQTLLSLAKSYYPKVFPNECLAATDALQEAQSKVLSCDDDSECANVDAQYYPIPAGQVQYVALKKCSVLPNLAGANAASLQSERKSLLKALDAAKASCAAENRELVCTTEVDIGFQNHRYPARCIAAKCLPGKTLH